MTLTKQQEEDMKFQIEDLKSHKSQAQEFFHILKKIVTGEAKDFEKISVLKDLLKDSTL